VATESGDFNIVAADANGCEVEAAIFDVLAGLPQTLSKADVAVFPNPFSDKLYFRALDGKSEVKIFDLLGNLVMTLTPRSAENGQGSEADVQSLSEGMYWIELTNGNKTFRTQMMKK